MNVRTPALLLAALVPAGCSGTMPYSSTISDADISYARETIIHASTAAEFLDGPGPSFYVTDRVPDGPLAASGFIRRARADIRALRGVLESAGLEAPTWSDVREHGAAHPDPGVRIDLPPDKIAAAADEAIVRRSLDYIDVGRSATIRHLARRAVDARLTPAGGSR
jgi:hypothetical protein